MASMDGTFAPISIGSPRSRSIFCSTKTSLPMGSKSSEAYIGSWESTPNINPNPLIRDLRPFFSSPFRIRVARLVSRLLFKHSADHQRIIAKQGDPASRLAARALRKIDRKILAPILKNPRPVLPESLRETLVEAYREDIEDLELILGRDLSAWKSSSNSLISPSILLAHPRLPAPSSLGFRIPEPPAARDGNAPAGSRRPGQDRKDRILR